MRAECAEKAGPRCGKCAGTHETGTCNFSGEKQCRNCAGKHESWSRKCKDSDMMEMWKACRDWENRWPTWARDLTLPLRNAPAHQDTSLAPGLASNGTTTISPKAATTPVTTIASGTAASSYDALVVAGASQGIGATRPTSTLPSAAVFPVFGSPAQPNPGQSPYRLLWNPPTVRPARVPRSGQPGRTPFSSMGTKANVGPIKAPTSMRALDTYFARCDTLGDSSKTTVASQNTRNQKQAGDDSIGLSASEAAHSRKRRHIAFD